MSLFYVLHRLCFWFCNDDHQNFNETTAYVKERIAESNRSLLTR